MRNKIIYLLIFIMLFFSTGYTGAKKYYKAKKWKRTVKAVVKVVKAEPQKENPDWPSAGYIYNEFSLTLTNRSSDINFYYEKIRELLEMEADIMPNAKIDIGLKDSIFPEGWNKNEIGRASCRERV